MSTGIAVYSEWQIECTSCGMVDGAKTREQAIERAEEHKRDVHDGAARRFGSFRAAYTYSIEGDGRDG